MPLDDFADDDTAPDPAPDRDPAAAPTPCEADLELQAVIDAEAAGRRWIESCLSVLTVAIDTDGWQGMEAAALRDLRVASMERAAREFRADREDRGDGG